MRHRLLLVLLFSIWCGSYSFGQSPSASPTPSTETRILGSSLEKHQDNRKNNPQRSRKRHEPSDDDIVKVATDLVINNVLVSNQKGNLILGLQKEDFIVTEDGSPQTIDIFSRTETVPRSIVLIMDATVANGPYREKSTEAAKVLVDDLASQDRLAIVSADLKLRLDFTNDKTLLKKTLDSLNRDLDYRFYKSNSELRSNYKGLERNEFCTLVAVLDEMFDGGERQPIVILESDGNLVIWLKPDKDSPFPVSDSNVYKKWSRKKYLPNFGFSEVKEAIEQSRVTIYSIIPGLRFLGLSKDEQLARAKITLTNTNRFYGWNKENNLPEIIPYYQYSEVETRIAGQTAMFKVAELSGGFADFIEKPEDAWNVYSNIFTVDAIK